MCQTKKHLPAAAAALDVPLLIFQPFLREANTLLLWDPSELQQEQRRG